MGYFRFYRRVKIAPGITLNFSKSGISASLGPRGAKVTFGRHGMRQTIGIPGTGLHYTEYTSWKTKKKANHSSAIPHRQPEMTSLPSKKSVALQTTPVKSESSTSSAKNNKVKKKKTLIADVEKKLTLSFLDRIFKTSTEINLIDGLRYFIQGQYDHAQKCLVKALTIPDAAFFAGFIALTKEKYTDAVEALTTALKQKAHLGKAFEHLEIKIHFRLSITDNIDLHISKPSERAVLFALAEAYQGIKNYQAAVDALSQLAILSPEDLIVKNSLAEVILEACPETDNADEMFYYVIDMAKGVENNSSTAASLLYFCGCAQTKLKLYDSAISTFSALVNKSTELNPELLNEIHYQRGITFWNAGDKIKAQEDFLWLEENSPNYKDVKRFI